MTLFEIAFSSSRNASSCLRSNSVIGMPRQESLGREHPLRHGAFAKRMRNCLVTRRSSPNCRSSKLVVRVTRRYAIGNFRFAMR